MKDNLHAILSKSEAYPVSLTLDCGSVITIPHEDFVHLAPRQKNLVFFPPDRKGESFELIALEKVVGLSMRL